MSYNYSLSSSLSLDAPMITAPVMQIDESVDETFKTNISCTASGLPAPTIQWFHNEEEVVNGSRDGRIALSSSESSAMDTLFTMSELLFITVERSDAGRYSCVASNGMGGNATIDPAYILFVNCEWVLLNTCRPLLRIKYYAALSPVT